MNMLENMYGNDTNFKADEDILSILEGYVQNLRKELQEVVVAIDDENPMLISQLAHKIKGTAGSYGLILVEQVFNDFKQLQDRLTKKELKQLVIELNDYLDRVLLMIN